MPPVHKHVRDLVAEAKAKIDELDAEEAIRRHAAGEIQIVDLRDLRERQREGFIPGSFHAPRGMLEFWVDPESPYHKEIFASGKHFVFHCASGWRSALATRDVQAMGLEPVSHVESGFSGWVKAGGPVEKTEDGRER